MKGGVLSLGPRRTTPSSFGLAVNLGVGELVSVGNELGVRILSCTAGETDRFQRGGGR